jgi:hypothetical protein
MVTSRSARNNRPLPKGTGDLSTWDNAAQIARQKLEERGSLDLLNESGHGALEPAVVKWLYWAESHQGSEIIYKTETDLVKGIPLNSFFDFPERYEAKIQQGAYVSLELEDGHSLVIYIQNCTRENLSQQIEAAKQSVSVTTKRPLQERMLEKLKEDGHLGFMSKEGISQLSVKLLKYIDYAVNIRPGSEVIYRAANGMVHGDTLEKLLERPELFEDIPKPVYLAIEVGDISVIFDTHDPQPATIHALMEKAQRMAENKRAKQL